MRRPSAWILFAAFLATAPAARAACPPLLSQLRTVSLPGKLKSLCELHDRYQAAKRAIAKREGLATEDETFRLQDAVAPRLIELETWEAAYGDGYTTPWRVYKKRDAPDTRTWGQFQAAARIVENQSLSNYRAGKFSPLSTDWFQSVHGVALDGLFPSAGKFRKGNMDVLPQANERFSLTRAEAEQVRRNEYIYPDSGEHIIQWTPVACVEHLDAAALKKLESKINSGGAYRADTYTRVADDAYFVGTDGQSRQCGYYGYAKGSQVKSLLKDFLSEINADLRRYNQGDVKQDPLRLASLAQRWYVTIHPHDDGNGRMSRFIMDQILLSLGLPAPILPDMGRDIFISEAEWANHIGQGLWRTLQIFEKCARPENAKARGCNLVPLDPPAGK
jgi:fido (protein-threonine AMPylation protein)